MTFVDTSRLDRFAQSNSIPQAYTGGQYPYLSSALRYDGNPYVLPVAAWGTHAVSQVDHVKPDLFAKITDRTKSRWQEETVRRVGDWALSNYLTSHQQTSGWVRQKIADGVSAIAKKPLSPEQIQRWAQAEVRGNVKYFIDSSGGLDIGHKTLKEMPAFLDTSHASTLQRYRDAYVQAIKSNFDRVPNAAASLYERFTGMFKNLMSTEPGVAKETLKSVWGNLKDYFRKSVIGEHTRGLAKFLAGNGGPVSAALSMFRVSLFGVGGVMAMKKAWEISGDKQENLLTRLFKTAKAGAKELFTSVIAYHVGSLAYPFAFGLVAIPGLNFFAGLAFAVGAGIIASKLIKKVIGEPVEDPAPVKPAPAIAV